MTTESELLWLIARLYMENRRGWGATSHLAPLQDEAAAVLSTTFRLDITQTEDSEIAALFKHAAAASEEAKG